MTAPLLLINGGASGLGAGAGLSEEALMEVLRPSQLYSKYFDLKMPTMVSRDFSSVVFDISGACALPRSLISSFVCVCRPVLTDHLSRPTRCQEGQRAHLG